MANSHKLKRAKHLRIRSRNRYCVTEMKIRKAAYSLYLPGKRENFKTNVNRCLDNYKRHCQKFQVVDVPTKGKGLITKEFIKKGSFIVEYEGDFLDRVAGFKREKKYLKYSSTTMTDLFQFEYKKRICWIDATRVNSGLGRFINHDKNPNGKGRLFVHGGKPNIIITATRDIPKGYEISIDYGETRLEVIEKHPFLQFKTVNEESRRVV